MIVQGGLAVARHSVTKPAVSAGIACFQCEWFKIFQTAVSNRRTTYQCRVFEIPQFNEARHIVKVTIKYFSVNNIPLEEG